MGQQTTVIKKTKKESQKRVKRKEANLEVTKERYNEKKDLGRLAYKTMKLGFDNFEFYNLQPKSPNDIFDGCGRVTPYYEQLLWNLSKITPADLKKRIDKANYTLWAEGVTFLLEGNDFRILPVDWFPRIVPKEHWKIIEKGLKQRLKAINIFLKEAYSGKGTFIPKELYENSIYWQPELVGQSIPRDTYVSIYGPDLVHMGNGNYVLLEDNLRIPSGSSYAMEYRGVTKRVFPEFFEGYNVAEFDTCSLIKEAARHLSHNRDPNPVIVLLTPGIYNSAYYDHKYLAEHMGIPLVEGSDLYIDTDGRVVLKSPDGEVNVDVIYRRIQDLDIFTPGLSKAYFKGKVNLMNALGTGIADDKGIFPYVEDMIREYLSEEPILKGAKTYSPRRKNDYEYIMKHAKELVIKAREGYGGHEVIIGPEVPNEVIESCKNAIRKNPEQFIAQECLDFGTQALMNVENDKIVLKSSYVDLRCYVIHGKETEIAKGGLTRVAQLGTRIVNSSSGGMCSDTWVLR